MCCVGVRSLFFVFLEDTATTEIYTYSHTRPLLDALPISPARQDYNYWLATSGSGFQFPLGGRVWQGTQNVTGTITSMSAGATFSLSSNFFGSSSRSEEHTSELQSLMRISYAVFCLKKTNYNNKT